jgi:hypothetical protein
MLCRWLPLLTSDSSACPLPWFAITSPPPPLLSYYYSRYDWDDLGNTVTCYGDNLQEAALTLGWTRDTWDGADDETTEIPDSECLGWMEFSSEQKWAMRVFGWTAIEWMSYPLDPRCPAPPEDEGQAGQQDETDTPPNWLVWNKVGTYNMIVHLLVVFQSGCCE